MFFFLSIIIERYSFCLHFKVYWEIKVMQKNTALIVIALVRESCKSGASHLAPFIYGRPCLRYCLMLHSCPGRGPVLSDHCLGSSPSFCPSRPSPFSNTTGKFIKVIPDKWKNVAEMVRYGRKLYQQMVIKVLFVMVYSN